MNASEDDPADVREATPVEDEIKKGEKDEYVDQDVRIAKKRERQSHCLDSTAKRTKVDRKELSKAQADCCRGNVPKPKRPPRTATVLVFEKPCKLPKLEIIPRHCLSKDDYVNLLSTPSRKCPPPCVQKTVVRTIRPISERIKELAQPTKQRVIATLQERGASLPIEMVDNLIKALEEETCMTPEQAAQFFRDKQRSSWKKRKSLRKTRPKPKLNKLSSSSSLDEAAVTCQYLMAERFVRSILEWSCPIPKEEFQDIAEVVLRRLSFSLEYTPIEGEDRKSQQMRFLADIIACWISGILVEVAEDHKEELEKELERLRLEKEEETEEEDDDLRPDYIPTKDTDIDEEEEEEPAVEEEKETEEKEATGETSEDRGEDKSNEEEEEERRKLEEDERKKKELEEAEKLAAEEAEEAERQAKEAEEAEKQKQAEEAERQRQAEEAEEAERQRQADEAERQKQAEEEEAKRQQEEEDARLAEEAERKRQEEIEAEKREEEERMKLEEEATKAQKAYEEEEASVEKELEEVDEELKKAEAERAEEERKRKEAEEEKKRREEEEERRKREEREREIQQLGPGEAVDHVGDFGGQLKGDIPFVTFGRILDTLYGMLEEVQESDENDLVKNRIQRDIYEKFANVIKAEDPKLLTENLKDVLDVMAGKIAAWLKNILTESEVLFMDKNPPEVESIEIRDWPRWIDTVMERANAWGSWIHNTIGEAEEKKDKTITRGDWSIWTKSVDTNALLWRRFYLETVHQAHHNKMMMLGRDVVKTGEKGKRVNREELLMTMDLMHAETEVAGEEIEAE